MRAAEYIPHAIEIADKFHVVQRLNKTIDDSRSELIMESKKRPTRKKELKKLHWILRYKEENIPEKRPLQLEILQKINELCCQLGRRFSVERSPS